MTSYWINHQCDSWFLLTLYNCTHSVKMQKKFLHDQNSPFARPVYPVEENPPCKPTQRPDRLRCVVYPPTSLPDVFFVGSATFIRVFLLKSCSQRMQARRESHQNSPCFLMDASGKLSTLLSIDSDCEEEKDQVWTENFNDLRGFSALLDSPFNIPDFSDDEVPVVRCLNAASAVQKFGSAEEEVLWIYTWQLIWSDMMNPWDMICRFQIVPEPQNGLECCQRSCLALFAAHQPARLAKILAEGHEHKFKIKDAGLCRSLFKYHSAHVKVNSPCHHATPSPPQIVTTIWRKKFPKKNTSTRT